MLMGGGVVEVVGSWHGLGLRLEALWVGSWQLAHVFILVGSSPNRGVGGLIGCGSSGDSWSSFQKRVLSGKDLREANRKTVAFKAFQRRKVTGEEKGEVCSGRIAGL